MADYLLDLQGEFRSTREIAVLEHHLREAGLPEAQIKVTHRVPGQSG
jgi:hypothetical protein